MLPYQSFDYLLCLHHKISPQNQLAQLSYIILSTRMHTFSDLQVFQIVPLVPPYLVTPFEQIITTLHSTITNIEKDRMSVIIVTFQKDLFETILPNQARIRNMILPAVFSSFISLGNNFKTNITLTLAEFADDLGEKVEMFQHQSILLSRCCLNLLKRNHMFDQLVYVDRLNRKGVVMELREDQGQGLQAGSGVIGIDNRDIDYKFYKLRGLPYKVVNQDIVNFLEIPELNQRDIEYQFRDGRFSGTAFVRVLEKDAQAVQAKNQKHLGNRYIEVNIASKLEFNKVKNQNDEMKQMLHRRQSRYGYGYSSSGYYNERRRRSRSNSRSRQHRRRRRGHSESSQHSCIYTIPELNNMGIMKMRGIPFEANEGEVLAFFSKFNPIHQSLKIGYNSQGRKTGEAVILFSTRKEAKEALELDRERIGSRYIQLITIKSEEYIRF